MNAESALSAEMERKCLLECCTSSPAICSTASDEKTDGNSINSSTTTALNSHSDWSKFSFGMSNTRSFRTFLVQNASQSIVSPWHDMPLYSKDGLVHCTCTAPAGEIIVHELAVDEDYNPLRVSLNSASLPVNDQLQRPSSDAERNTNCKNQVGTMARAVDNSTASNSTCGRTQGKFCEVPPRNFDCDGVKCSNAAHTQRLTMFSSCAPWNHGFIPRTQQLATTFTKLLAMNVQVDSTTNSSTRSGNDCQMWQLNRPLEVIEIGRRQMELGDVYPVKLLGVVRGVPSAPEAGIGSQALLSSEDVQRCRSEYPPQAERSMTAEIRFSGDVTQALASSTANISINADVVVAIAGDDPLAQEVEGLEDMEQFMPGLQCRLISWLKSRFAATVTNRAPSDFFPSIETSPMLSDAELASLHEPWQVVAENSAAHVTVAQCNAAWQLQADQDVPPAPWPLPPSQTLESTGGSTFDSIHRSHFTIMEGIWKKRYPENMKDTYENYYSLDGRAPPIYSNRLSTFSSGSSGSFDIMITGGSSTEGSDSEETEASGIISSSGADIIAKRTGALLGSTKTAARHLGSTSKRVFGLFRTKSGKLLGTAKSTATSSLLSRQNSTEKCPAPKGHGSATPGLSLLSASTSACNYPDAGILTSVDASSQHAKDQPVVQVGYPGSSLSSTDPANCRIQSVNMLMNLTKASDMLGTNRSFGSRGGHTASFDLGDLERGTSSTDFISMNDIVTAKGRGAHQRRHHSNDGLESFVPSSRNLGNVNAIHMITSSEECNPSWNTSSMRSHFCGPHSRRPANLSPLRVHGDNLPLSILKKSNTISSVTTATCLPTPGVRYGRNDDFPMAQFLPEDFSDGQPVVAFRRSASEKVSRNWKVSENHILEGTDCRRKRNLSFDRKVSFKEEVDVVMFEGANSRGDDEEKESEVSMAALRFSLSLALDGEGEVFPSPRQILHLCA